LVLQYIPEDIDVSTISKKDLPESYKEQIDYTDKEYLPNTVL